MKVIMGVIAIGLLAVMALKYGAYLAAGSTDAMANVDSMKRSIAARNEAMSELGGPAAMPVEAAPPPATVSPSPTPSSFDRMFSTEAMQQGGGVATFNAVPKTKCEELAKKWKGSVSVNGVTENPAAACKRTGNVIEREL